MIVGSNGQGKRQVLHVVIDIPPLWLCVIVPDHVDARQHHLAVEYFLVSAQLELVMVVVAVYHHNVVPGLSGEAPADAFRQGFLHCSLLVFVGRGDGFLLGEGSDSWLFALEHGEVGSFGELDLAESCVNTIMIHFIFILVKFILFWRTTSYPYALSLWKLFRLGRWCCVTIFFPNGTFNYIGFPGVKRVLGGRFYEDMWGKIGNKYFRVGWWMKHLWKKSNHKYCFFMGQKMGCLTFNIAYFCRLSKMIWIYLWQTYKWTAKE